MEEQRRQHRDPATKLCANRTGRMEIAQPADPGQPTAGVAEEFVPDHSHSSVILTKAARVCNCVIQAVEMRRVTPQIPFNRNICLISQIKYSDYARCEPIKVFGNPPMFNVGRSG